jgi:hypothetical protein
MKQINFLPKYEGYGALFLLISFHCSLHCIVKNLCCHICSLYRLLLTFPKDRFALLAAGSRAVSTGNAIETCVGCIDGFLQQIIMLHKKEDDRMQSYYAKPWGSTSKQCVRQIVISCILHYVVLVHAVTARPSQ